MPSARTKILLVEDNPSDRQFLDACIQDAGLPVELHHAARLDEASAYFKQQHFQLVITDLNLPDAEGLETFYKVKAMAAEAAIVVMTGMDDTALATSAVLAGAQDYLVKGDLNSRKVWQSVSNALQRHDHLQRIAGEVHDLRKRNSSLRELAYIDPLTGLCNRRGLSKILARGLERRASALSAYALLIDVDDFKTVNDLFGYNEGDAVLKAIGRRIKALLRASDIGARVGGDEFLLLVSLAGQDAAMALAERLRASISERGVAGDAGPGQVSVSIGVVPLGLRPYRVEDLLQVAHGALRMSKDGGKNRVAYCGEPLPVSERAVIIEPYFEIVSGQVAGYRYSLAGGPSAYEDAASSRATLHRLMAAAAADKAGLECLLELSHIQLMQLSPADMGAGPQVEPWRLRLCIPAIPMSPLPPGLLDAIRRLQWAGWALGLTDLDLGAHSWANLILLEPTVVTLAPNFVAHVSSDREKQRGLLRLQRALSGLGAVIVAGGASSREDLHALERLGISFAWGQF